jgi:hypothetical protein
MSRGCATEVSAFNTHPRDSRSVPRRAAGVLVRRRPAWNSPTAPGFPMPSRLTSQFLVAVPGPVRDGVADWFFPEIFQRVRDWLYRPLSCVNCVQQLLVAEGDGQDDAKPPTRVADVGQGHTSKRCGEALGALAGADGGIAPPWRPTHGRGAMLRSFVPRQRRRIDCHRP